MFNHFISRKFQYNLLYLYIFIYNFITCIFSLPLIWCFKTWWFDYLNTEIFRHGTVHPWPVKLPSLMSPHQQYHVSHTDSLVRTSKVQDPEVQNDQTWHDLVWAVYTRTRHYSTVMQMENRIGYRRPPNNLTGKKRKGSAKSLGYLKKQFPQKQFPGLARDLASCWWVGVGNLYLQLHKHNLKQTFDMWHSRMGWFFWHTEASSTIQIIHYKSLSSGLNLLCVYIPKV